MKKLSGIIIVIAVLFSFSAFCETPYLMKLSADTAIYLGPGENYGFNRYVGEDGVFTIAEERIGEDGFMWGKLKSGAGWVKLTYAFENAYGYPETPFTVKLPKWVSIFDNAGFDALYRKNIGKDGVYTIVETVFDDENNLWGRLKSGAGWVNITQMEYQKTLPAVIAFLDEDILNEDKYLFCPADASEYSVKVALYPRNAIRNVRFFSLQPGDAFWKKDRILYENALIRSDLPLVVEVTFWGDMTTFGLDFTDEYGLERHYLISISGRNGALCAQEYHK